MKSLVERVDDDLQCNIIRQVNTNRFIDTGLAVCNARAANLIRSRHAPMRYSHQPKELYASMDLLVAIYFFRPTNLITEPMPL